MLQEEPVQLVPPPAREGHQRRRLRRGGGGGPQRAGLLLLVDEDEADEAPGLGPDQGRDLRAEDEEGGAPLREAGAALVQLAAHPGRGGLLGAGRVLPVSALDVHQAGRVQAALHVGLRQDVSMHKSPPYHVVG